MQKLFFTLLFISFLSCKHTENGNDKFDRWMSELDCPVILIGKTDKAVVIPSVTVRDGGGRVRMIGGSNERKGMAASIADSRSIGDTLKPCN